MIARERTRAAMDALSAAERRAKRRRASVRDWSQGLAIGIGFALLAAIGHALTAWRW